MWLVDFVSLCDNVYSLIYSCNKYIYTLRLPTSRTNFPNFVLCDINFSKL